jgi:5S rRNA maturation endonuclease (ribonuclease M5)
MISTKNLIARLEDVPKEWVFEFYLNLSEKLTGQSVKIKSIFNNREKTASMYIYMDNNNTYKFKDFSSGNGGDALNLIQIMFNLPSRASASFKIIDDYNEYVKTHEPAPVVELKAHSKFKVSDYEIRHWNNLDQNYWMSFNIGSKMLEHYNVAPLKFYTMTKEDNLGIESHMTISTNYIYGYFKDDGSLYKIYQPKVRDSKFIKVRDYLQGSEQLRGDKKFLVITSSLKDLMAFNRLKITDAESIAPDSENSMIAATYMLNAIKHYKKVFVLFDNDEAGQKAAQKYHNTFGVATINLPMEKDLSDSVKVYGIDAVRSLLLSLLKHAL